MTDPVVSVIMPSYNGASLIGETLESLAAQTFADFEVLVVNDASTDGTAALIANWPDRRVRLIEMERNGGPVRARNRGVAEARGRYIAALDQDDLCMPDRLARQVAYLDANPDTVLVGTDAKALKNGRIGRLNYPANTTPALIAWLCWIENPLVWSTIMLRADAARKLDVFSRQEVLYAEDFDIYHRFSALGTIARIDAPLLLYRQHAGGISKRFEDTMMASAAQVLADRHADLLGDRAPRIARLLVQHNMGGYPVRDRETLETLGSALVELQSAFIARHRPDDASLRLIRWETARRWGAIGRAALRSGAVTLPELMAQRPPHLGLGYATIDALLMSGVVGGARRLGAQTLAEKIMRPGPRAAKT